MKRAISINRGAAEFIQIRKVLGAAGGLLGDDEIGFAQILDGHFSVSRLGIRDLDGACD
jgi:hypothetical protein